MGRFSWIDSSSITSPGRLTGLHVASSDYLCVYDICAVGTSRYDCTVRERVHTVQYLGTSCSYWTVVGSSPYFMHIHSPFEPSNGIVRQCLGKGDDAETDCLHHNQHPRHQIPSGRFVEWLRGCVVEWWSGGVGNPILSDFLAGTEYFTTLVRICHFLDGT